MADDGKIRQVVSRSVLVDGRAPRADLFEAIQAPLVVASFKILDAVLSAVLEANSHDVQGFAALLKVWRRHSSMLARPNWLARSPSLETAILTFFESLAKYRNEIIHGDGYEIVNGSLVFEPLGRWYTQSHWPSLTLSQRDIRDIGRTAICLYAIAVGAERSSNALRAHLTQLRHRHGHFQRFIDAQGMHRGYDVWEVISFDAIEASDGTVLVPVRQIRDAWMRGSTLPLSQFHRRAAKLNVVVTGRNDNGVVLAYGPGELKRLEDYSIRVGDDEWDSRLIT